MEPCWRARGLFARVLDLPGGMRIGTIYAFCQSLLRRFPLEAAFSPHFLLVDDRDAEDALTEARETMLPQRVYRARVPRWTHSPVSHRRDSLAGTSDDLQGDLPRLGGGAAPGDSLARGAKTRTRSQRDNADDILSRLR